MKNDLLQLYDYKKINQHQLNSSKSKYMYSFPKNKRFFITKKTINPNFYSNLDKNYYKSKRTTGIGYGNKYDFTKTSKNNPAPNTYNIKRNWSNISFTFGVSRNKMVNSKINNNPGPGYYDLKDKKSNIKWSFKLKLDNNNLNKKKNLNNNYKFYNIKPTLNSTGINFISKYKNSKAPKFNPLKINNIKQLKKEKNKGIWPYYKIGGDINKIGNYNNSKYISSKCTKFSKSQRKFFNNKNNIPGPGEYILPSDFGVYISSNYKNKLLNI